MNIGIYPGSFDPFHVGHLDVLEKALKVFDKVVIVTMFNENKVDQPDLTQRREDIREKLISLSKFAAITEGYKGNFETEKARIIIIGFGRTLKELVDAVATNVFSDHNLPEKENDYSIIRGLRSSKDFEESKDYQYWNEDVGVDAPFVYFIADRRLTHLSSSGIKAVRAMKLVKPDYIGFKP